MKASLDTMATPTQSTESTTLLGREEANGGKKRSRWLKGVLNPSAFSKLDIHDDDAEWGEASDVELFSDLVVVVSIHMLSDLLEEGDEEGEENVWWWFVLRVFYVYALWLQYMEVANLHNLYSNLTHRVDSFYYIMIFGFMAILVVISKACEKDQHRMAAIVYLVGRAWGLVVIGAESHMPRTLTIEPRMRQFYRKYSVVNPRYFVVEGAPLILALILRRDDDVVLLRGGLAMIACRIATRFAVGLRADLSDDYDLWDGKLLHTDHTKERYKLVTLIFLGELCFSATSVRGNYYTSLSALVTAMGCFACYFLARVEGRVEAWDRSALCNLQCHTTHFVIFCTVPVMGVGYMEIMKENVDHDAHDEEPSGERPWYSAPHAILSIAAAAFLFSLGHLEMLTEDPEFPKQHVRMKRWMRVSLYFVMGVVLAGIHFVIEYAATYVPIIIVGTGLTLIWGIL